MEQWQGFCYINLYINDNNHLSLNRDVMLTKLKTLKLNKVVLNSLFFLALLTMGTISYLTYSQLQNLIKANRMVSHTYEVIGKIDATLSSLAEIESNQRGYLIAGNKDFLRGLQISKKNLNESLKDAIVLTEVNIKQNIRIRHLTQLINDRLTILFNMISYKDNNTLNTPEGLALFNSGSIISSQAKDLGREIKSVEEVLLNERNNLTIDGASQSSLYLLLGSIFSTLFLILPFTLANIELFNRERSEDINRNARIHLRQIIESTSDMIAALNSKGEFDIFNEAYQREFKRLFGKSLVKGMSMDEGLAEVPNNKNNLLQTWKKSLKTYDEPLILELDIDNNRYVYELMGREIKNEFNEVRGLVHTVKDVTSRVHEHSALQESYKKLSEGMKELEIKNEQITLLVDMSDIMLAASSQAELSNIMAKFAHALMGFSNGVLYIMHPSKNYLEKASSWGTPHRHGELIMPDQCWSIRLGRLHQVRKMDKDLVCEHIDAGNKSQSYICVPLMAQNDIYGLIYIEIVSPTFVLNEESRLIITAFSELTALALANVRLRENLRHQSIRDSLTGLYNRRYFEEALFKQIHQAQRSEFTFSILMLDIDHFKKINDGYGHEVGDLALREVGKLLESSIRQGDLAARYGGEEFIILLHNADSEKALKRADKIRLDISKLQIKYGAEHVIPLTISIGIASYPKDNEDKDKLVELADNALYAAKHSGRNKVVLYSEMGAKK